MSDNVNFEKLAEQMTLCQIIDRVLYKGAVISGDITISVADIELIYVSLQLVVSSVDNISSDVN